MSLSKLGNKLQFFNVLFFHHQTPLSLYKTCKIGFQKFVTCYLMCRIGYNLEGLFITTNSTKDPNIFYRLEVSLDFKGAGDKKDYFMQFLYRGHSN